MRQVDHTNNEQRLLLAVQYPFIVNLWGTFQDFTNLYMVMDFVAGGELFTLLRRSNVSYLSPFHARYGCGCVTGWNVMLSKCVYLRVSYSG